MSTAVLLALLCLHQAPHFTASTEPTPCTFNPLCTCTHDLTDEATCTNVAYTSLPTLPARCARFTLADTDSLLVLRNTTSSPSTSPDLTNLRITNTPLTRIEPCAFCSLDLTALDLSGNRLRSFPGRAVNSLRRLQWLDLRRNFIQDLADVDKAPRSLQSLHLSQNSINAIKDRQFTTLRNLTVLDLNDNRILAIEGNPFPVSLLRLNLSGNLLQDIPRGPLSTLKSLAYLSLSDNLIKTLPEKWTLPTHHLVALDLGRNLVSALPEQIFNGTAIVRHLDLGANFFNYFPAEALNGIAVQKLSLSTNHLISLPDKCFDGLEIVIQELDLSHNYMDHVPRPVKSLHKLRTLGLDGNKIAALEEYDLFTCRDSLQVLNLASNVFRAVPTSAIKFLGKLSVLNLRDNLIQKVETDDFRLGCERVVVLDLSYNGIETLPADVFTKLLSLKELYLSFNPINTLDVRFLKPLRHTLHILDISSLDIADNVVSILGTQPRSLTALHASHSFLRVLPLSKHSGLPNLETLTLNDNAISEILPGIFDPAVCEKLSAVFLQNNAVRELLPGTFHNLSNLQTLALSSNAIETISSNAFDLLPRLQTLLLDNNRIASIAPKAFNAIPRVVHVSLAGNKLSRVDLTVFRRVSRLSHNLVFDFSRNVVQEFPTPTGTFVEDEFPLRVRDLNLSHNRLSSLPAGFFWSIRRGLLRVDLSYNRLTSLSVETISEFPRIQVLYINDNDIERLSPRAFQAASHLQVLSLSGNSLKTVPSEAFASLVRLSVVDLSRNAIDWIPEDAFDGTALQKLNLSRNRLVRPFTKALLPARSTFVHLDLAYNRIVVVAAFEFAGLHNLESLNLSSNKVVVLPDNAFANLSRLQVLDLSNNPLWRVDATSLMPLKSLDALYLINCNLAHVPALFTPDLTLLSLRSNFVSNLSADSFVGVPRLRLLDLAKNRLEDVPRDAWRPVRDVRTLDLSRNPVKILGGRNLGLLERLEDLDIRGLDLKFLDARALDALKIIRTVKTNTYAGVRAFRLQELLSRAESLKNVFIEVEETLLSYQIQWSFGGKIASLHIWGPNLGYLAGDALTGLHPHGPFTLRLGPTRLRALPATLLRQLRGVPGLSLDLTKNELLTTIQAEEDDPGEGSEPMPGHNVWGTLSISGVPWTCGCHLLWFRRWLRRQRPTGSEIEVRTSGAGVNEPNCVVPSSGATVPIVELIDGTPYCISEAHSGADAGLVGHVLCAVILLGLAYAVT